MLRYLMLLLPWTLAAQEVSGPPGPRRLLEREVEIPLARSAAPPSVSAAATVWYFDQGRYVVAEAGSNGVECLVSRGWSTSLEPQCFDAEAARTVMRIDMRAVELAHAGVAPSEAARQLALGLADGTFQLPQRLALTWMMSAAQELVGDDGKPAGAWRPHLMVYYPYLTAEALGLGGNDMAAGIVVNGGKPTANLMIVVPTAVEPTTAGRSPP